MIIFRIYRALRAKELALRARSAEIYVNFRGFLLEVP